MKFNTYDNVMEIIARRRAETAAMLAANGLKLENEPGQEQIDGNAAGNLRTTFDPEYIPGISDSDIDALLRT